VVCAVLLRVVYLPRFVCSWTALALLFGRSPEPLVATASTVLQEAFFDNLHEPSTWLHSAMISQGTACWGRYRPLVTLYRSCMLLTPRSHY
jgi:hypothetical protein